MSKFVKLLLGLLLAVVVIVVAAAIIIPMVVDPNDYKDEIAKAVKEQTGRTLSIEGDIGLSVFPWLGIELGPTRFSNADGFSAPDMASMEAVEIRVMLLPLLSKNVEIGTVKLDGLQLSLEKDASGRTNWDDLMAGDQAQEEAGDDREREPGELEELAVGGIAISGARVTWDDRAAGQSFEISDLALTTGTIAEGETFDIDLNFGVSASEPAMEGRFSLQGNVALGDDMESIEIAGAEIGFTAAGSGLPGGKLDLGLSSDISVDFEEGTLSMPRAVLEAFGVTLTGKASGSDITGDAAQFSGNFAIAAFSPRDVLAELGQPAPVTADAGVLSKAEATLDWQASTNHFTASKLAMTLDDTRINGQAKVAGFDAPAISFGLDVDSIDVDRYLPPAAEQPEAGQPAATGKAAASEPLPMDALRKLNINGSLKIGSLKAMNIRSKDVVVKLTAKDGVIRVDPATANLYQGSVKSALTMNVQQDTPRLSTSHDISNVQAGPFLKDLTGKDTLTGTANANASLKASGTDADAIKRTLSGDTKFSFTDGTVKGVNIAALIRNAQAKLKGDLAPQEDAPNQTDFAEMSGTATISNGLVKNNDLSMKSPLLRISGAGETSLPKETIDYTLTTKFVGSLEGQGGKAVSELKGVEIPVHISGTYSNPTYKPDLGGVLKDAAKAQVEERVEEEKQKLQEKLGDEVSDKLLKGLFK